MTIDYGAMLRSRTIETRFSVCLEPSLVWDRNIIARAEHPDAEAIADLDARIAAATVVVVLRALTEDETWALDQRYINVPPGTPEARKLDKSTLLKGFVRWETLDGDTIDSLGKKDLEAYWDSTSPGERVPLIALALELRTFNPAVPF